MKIGNSYDAIFHEEIWQSSLIAKVMKKKIKKVTKDNFPLTFQVVSRYEYKQVFFFILKESI